MIKKIIFKRSLFFICLFLAGTLINILLHEFGHCLPAISKGGGINRIVVLGYEIIPNFGLKTHFVITASFANVNWPTGYDPTEYWKGFQKLSGAGFTLLVSFISIVLLWLIKPKRILRFILLVLSFGFLDIFSYSFLPLFGLPHRLFVGAKYSETVEGLMHMGFSKTYSLLLILFCVSVTVYLLICYLKKDPMKENLNT